MDTYCTLSSARFSKDPVPAKDSLESRLVNVIENENFKSILSLAQMFTKAIYLSQEIGSLASEGEIKTFAGRYTVSVKAYYETFEVKQKYKSFMFW